MEKTTWRKAGQNLLQYALFIIFSAGALGVLLLVRTDLLHVGYAFNYSNQVLWMMDVGGMFVLVSLFIISVAWIESYLRAGLKEHDLRRRVRKLIIIEAVAGLASYGLTLLL